MEIKLENLKREISYKYRVQSFSKAKPQATCVAYIDSRDVMDLLDEVCGSGNWQTNYYEVKGNLFCNIGIKINNEWVWKSNCGTESNTDKEKGEASDAFKRAAVLWGIGRFLYSKGMVYMPSSAKKESNNYPFVVDEYGKQVYDLTKEIHKKIKSNKPNILEPKPTPIVENNNDLIMAIQEIVKCNSVPELSNVWKKYKSFQTNKAFMDAKDKKKVELSKITA